MKLTHFIRAELLVLTFFLTSSLQGGDIGLMVGETAPEFQLKNQTGKEIALADLTTQHEKVALVFYRSAGWCPICKRQLIGLQEDLESIEKAGIRLVAISYDSVETLDRFSKKQNIGYTLLSDPGSKTIDAYKVRNEQVRNERAVGIPHPTIFLLDNNGVIAKKLREESYRDRPTVEQILAAAKGMD